MTSLNCIRVLRDCVMEAAISVGPTGCSASLSKGQMSHRLFKFPRGIKINLQPYDSNISKVADAQAFLSKMEALFALVSDEVSMKGRKHLAWEDHRCREGRKHIVSNADRTWGGILSDMHSAMSSNYLLLLANHFMTVILQRNLLPHVDMVA